MSARWPDTPAAEIRSSLASSSNPPIGIYSIGGGSWFGGLERQIGVPGNLFLVYDSTRSDENTFVFDPIVSGTFRMSPNDTYGDAWYTVTWFFA